MAENRIREMPGNGADIEKQTPKIPGSDVRNGTRQPVNISSKNGAMSVSIPRRDAGISITMPFERTSTQAKIAFDSGIDPHSRSRDAMLGRSIGEKPQICGGKHAHSGNG
jgi:hypothetical protein